MNIPAINYMKCVKQYAMAKGMPFFTWEQQKKAIEYYNREAAVKN